MPFRVFQRGIVVSAFTVVWLFASSAGFCAVVEECADITITRGPADVSLPASSTASQSRRYGLGFPVQIGPKTAALFCQLRTVGPNRIDYEDGTDVFVFDDLDDVAANGPTPISRNEKEKDPETGKPRFIVKYPACGGFWPLGAKRPDGSPHPGAGKGFAFCQALSFLGAGDALPWGLPVKPYLEVMQLSFDGQRVSVVKRDLIRSKESWQTADGWSITSTGIGTAIPDGDDLLTALLANKDGQERTGVCRFCFTDGQWRPVAFTPVTGGFEPSLVRRRDGSLAFGVRPSGEISPDRKEDNSIMLWESTDGGATWKQIVHVKKVRTESPVSVHTAPDGTVLVAANVLGTKRSRLAMWPLAESVAELGSPQLIRDCQEEFGKPPAENSSWNADHPISATLRLNDGRWHVVMAYRLMSFPLRGQTETDTPQTGCYVEEMLYPWSATPPWRF